jgi:hypothetical protein
MTYSRKFDLNRYTRLGNLPEKLADLEPGQRAKLTELTGVREIEELRWLLYDLLHHLGLKSQFRVRTDYEAREIVVQRRRTNVARVELDCSGLDEGKLRELVCLRERGDVDKALESWVNEKKLTLSEALRLAEEWEKVMR